MSPVAQNMSGICCGAYIVWAVLGRHLRATRKSAVRPCILHPSVARGIHSFRSTRFERTEQMTTNQEWMTERAGRVGEGCKMQGRPVWHASVWCASGI